MAKAKNNPNQPSPARAGGPSSAVEGFIDVLRSAELVDEPMIRWALEESRLAGRAVHELLAERAPGAEEGVYAALAEYLGVDFESLERQEVDGDLAQRLPSEFALEHQIAPLRRDDRELVVVTSRPQMLMQESQVSTIVGGPVRMALGPPSRLHRLIQDCYGLGAETVSKLVSEGAESDSAITISMPDTVAILENLDSSQEASVTKFVNQIFAEAVKSHASDIHIEPYEHQLRVRFRIDGVLQEIPIPPAVKKLEQAIISRVKVLADLDIAEKRLSQDGQLRLTVLGRVVDIRVSVLPSIYGESLVLRILDMQTQFRDLGEIGMPESMLQTVTDILSLAQGLVLVTGPTGSGKTTTLYAALNHVNTPGRKIITVEDPVEYRLEGITQIQVKESIGLGFSTLLRSMVRHDPDVIMVGEIRDAVTASMAVNAAITGHLVLATVHTSDAPTAVARLASMGTPSYMISSALKVVLAQRLARVLCPRCKQPAESIAPDVLEEFPGLRGRTLYQARGCEACRFTGYSGRTGFYELLKVTDSLSEIINRGGRGRIRTAAVQEGMVPLRLAGMMLVENGVTTIDELYRITREIADGAPVESKDGAQGEGRRPQS